MTAWNNINFEILIKFLSEREYLYNRNHPNYKIYTVVKECAEFGALLNPPKSSKEVLDKITAIRKDVTRIRQIIEDDYTQYSCSDLEKFKENVIKLNFMYSALFGKYHRFITKLNHFLGVFKKNSEENDKPEAKKRKLCESEEEISENVDIFSAPVILQNDSFTKKIPSLQEENIPFKSPTKVGANSFPAECALNYFNNDLINDPIDNNNFATHNLSRRNQDYTDCEFRDSKKSHSSAINKNNEINRKIINFIRCKPYYYKEDADLYEDTIFKEQELNRFGKTFNPPITSTQLMYIISQNKQNICNSMKNSKKMGLLNAAESTKYPVKISKLEKTRVDDPKLMLEVMTFIEDNPCFYDENSEDYYDNNKKKCMKNRFKAALQYKYKEAEIQNMLDSVEERINKSNSCKNLVSDEMQMRDNIENVCKFNSSIPFFDCDLIKDTIKKKATYKVASVQCNLYEELLEQKIKDSVFSNCNCNCLENFIQPLFPKKEVSTISTFQDVLKESDIIEWDNANIQEIDDDNNKIGNYIIDVDFPEFSDISSDDGLTEIPFEDEKPKFRPFRLSNGKIPCEECDEMFDDYVQLNAHEQTHGEKSLVCYKCGKINRYYRKLRLHENNCNPEGNKYCYECNVTFKNHLNYYDHQNQYHTKSNPYVCICRQAFTSYNKIITHLNRSDCGAIDDCVLPEYVTKDFIKGFLEQTYDDESEFVKTMEKTKFWCRICKRNYVRNDVYTKHFTRQFHLTAERNWMKKNSIEKIFACDYCNKEDEPTTFKTMHQLVTHRHATHHKCTLGDFFEGMENIAASEKPSELQADMSLISLVCRICKLKYDMCNYRDHFRYNYHKKHERNWIINHNMKSFTCNICAQQFCHLIDYLEHKHVIHLEWPTNKLIKEIEGINSELVGKKYFKYYCSICDYKTNNRRSYANHIMVHGSHYVCSCGSICKVYEKFLAHKSLNNCSKNDCIEFSSKSVFKLLK